MRQLLVKRIIKRIEENKILYDYNDCEAMDVVYDDEMNYLKSYMDKQDLTAFVFNMALMYLNFGLKYAKRKLPEKEFDNYFMCISILVDDYSITEQCYYSCQVVFSRRANKILPYYYDLKPIDVRFLDIYPSVKDIVGLDDFYCYEYLDDSYDYDCRQYFFVPKFFVDRYRESLNFGKCK